MEKENERKRAIIMSMEEDTEYRRAKITKVDKACMLYNGTMKTNREK
jgi:hypothetical protein